MDNDKLVPFKDVPVGRYFILKIDGYFSGAYKLYNGEAIASFDAKSLHIKPDDKVYFSKEWGKNDN